MRPLSLVRDVWRHRRGQVNRPRFLTYLVTFQCNARCLMCDSWKKPAEDELSLKALAAFLAQLPRMDAVRLSGGEPFVRPDFPEIVQLVTDRLRPRFVHVTSNGFLTRRIVEFCERRPRATPLHLLISLDGTRAKHNQVRGRETAWDTAFATVSALAPRQRELGLRLAVNQTIVDRDGLPEHRKLRDLLQPLGVRVHAVLAYDVSATYSLQRELEAAPTLAGTFPAFGAFDPGSVEELMAGLESGLRGLRWPERLAKDYYFTGLRSRLQRQEATPNPSCVALSSHLRLHPNGDVPVCQFNSRRVGNLRRESFESLWFGAETRRQRDWVRRCPGCWAECEVLPNALYSGDVFRHATSRLRSSQSGGPPAGRPQATGRQAGPAGSNVL